MTRSLDFLKTTVVGGFLVVIPLVLLILIVDETLAVFEALIAPVAELLPVDELGGMAVANLVGFGLILGFWFLAGLVARTAIGARTGGWLEDAVLGRLPGYRMMKTLSRQVAGAGGADSSMFVPAVLELPEDSMQLVYLIEEHPNGYATIMIPNVPAALAGPLQCVPSRRLRKLDVSLARVVQSLQACGLGAGEFFDEKLGDATPRV
jgi:uncharacterized membrane protein